MAQRSTLVTQTSRLRLYEETQAELKALEPTFQVQLGLAGLRLWARADTLLSELAARMEGWWVGRGRVVPDH